MSEQPAPADAPGKLDEDAQAVLEAARATARAYVGSFTALRRLFAAEVALTRDALIQALVCLMVVTVMLGTAYGLLTALLVSTLSAFGAPLPLAIAIPLALSLGVAWLGYLKARAALRLADFEATRRQLRQGFGIGGEDEDPEASP